MWRRLGGVRTIDRGGIGLQATTILQVDLGERATPSESLWARGVAARGCTGTRRRSRICRSVGVCPPIRRIGLVRWRMPPLAQVFRRVRLVLERKV